MDSEELTGQDFTALIVDQFGEGESNRVLTLVNKWIERGDTALIYRNEELGHPNCGGIQIVSYGGPKAQIERAQFSEPPIGLPDIGGSINWRYRLFARHSGH